MIWGRDKIDDPKKVKDLLPDDQNMSKEDPRSIEHSI